MSFSAAINHSWQREKSESRQNNLSSIARATSSELRSPCWDGSAVPDKPNHFHLNLYPYLSCPVGPPVSRLAAAANIKKQFRPGASSFFPFILFLLNAAHPSISFFSRPSFILYLFVQYASRLSSIVYLPHYTHTLTPYYRPSSPLIPAPSKQTPKRVNELFPFPLGRR